MTKLIGEDFANMPINLSDFNDAQKSLIDPKDRRGMGKLGVTHSEARAVAMAKNEREFQKEVLAYLRVNGVRMIINPPMNKRSQLPVGWADFTFVYRGVPVVWEAKIGKNVLQPDQVKAREALIADGWQYREVRSIFDCQRHLREIEKAQADLGTIYVFAARYAHNRATGASLAVVNFLKSVWDSILPRDKDMILHESKDAAFNREDWEKLRELSCGKNRGEFPTDTAKPIDTKRGLG